VPSQDAVHFVPAILGNGDIIEALMDFSRIGHQVYVTLEPGGDTGGKQ